MPAFRLQRAAAGTRKRRMEDFFNSDDDDDNADSDYDSGEDGKEKKGRSKSTKASSLKTKPASKTSNLFDNFDSSSEDSSVSEIMTVPSPCSPSKQHKGNLATASDDNKVKEAAKNQNSQLDAKSSNHDPTTESITAKQPSQQKEKSPAKDSTENSNNPEKTTPNSDIKADSPTALAVESLLQLQQPVVQDSLATVAALQQEWPTVEMSKSCISNTPRARQQQQEQSSMALSAKQVVEKWTTKSNIHHQQQQAEILKQAKSVTAATKKQTPNESPKTLPKDLDTNIDEPKTAKKRKKKDDQPDASAKPVPTKKTKQKHPKRVSLDEEFQQTQPPLRKMAKGPKEQPQSTTETVSSPSPNDAKAVQQEDTKQLNPTSIPFNHQTTPCCTDDTAKSLDKQVTSPKQQPSELGTELLLTGTENKVGDLLPPKSSPNPCREEANKQFETAVAAPKQAAQGTSAVHQTKSAAVQAVTHKTPPCGQTPQKDNVFPANNNNKKSEHEDAEPCTMTGKDLTNTTPTSSTKKTAKKKPSYQDKVLRHMVLASKPFLLRTLASELQTSETQLEYLMLSLTDKGLVKKKDFASKNNKSKTLYWSHLEANIKAMATFLASPEEIAETKSEYTDHLRKQSAMTQTAQTVAAEIGNEELDAKLAAEEEAVSRLQQEIQAVKDRIQKGQQPKPSPHIRRSSYGPPPKSAAELAREQCPHRLKIRINNMRSEWVQRKQICVDLIENLADGMEKKPKEVIKLLDVETDEMVGVKLPPKQVITATKKLK